MSSFSGPHFSPLLGKKDDMKSTLENHIKSVIHPKDHFFTKAI